MLAKFQFKAKIWLYDGHAAWHFLTVDSKTSKAIKSTQNGPRRGWGSIRVTAEIGKTTWETSIFPDKKEVYLLPIKSVVRKKENISAGDTITCTLIIEIKEPDIN